MADWTIEWWKWLMSKNELESPMTVVGPARPHRYIAGQPTALQQQALKEYGESVWFIAAAPYVEPNSTIHINIPQGNWSILAATAVTQACTEEFPSLRTIEQLRDAVYKDMNDTYELYALLDGFSLDGGFVDLTDRRIEIDNLPPVEKNKNNPLGVASQQEGSNKIHSVQCGHWVWIKPLAPGDHLLHLHGLTKVYNVDIRFQLTVTGP